jgi:uncharacterized protein YcnI
VTSRRSALVALLVLAAGALAAPAGAHVVPSPSYITHGVADTVSLETPNERDAPMTGLVVTVPGDVEIVHAHGPAVWAVSVKGSEARWSGAELAPRAVATFGLVLEAKRPPGTIRLEADQLYRDGGVVRWPIQMTVVPGKSSPSQNLELAALVGLVGILVIAIAGVLAWRRSSTPRPAG